MASGCFCCQMGLGVKWARLVRVAGAIRTVPCGTLSRRIQPWPQSRVDQRRERGSDSPRIRCGLCRGACLQNRRISLKSIFQPLIEQVHIQLKSPGVTGTAAEEAAVDLAVVAPGFTHCRFTGIKTVQDRCGFRLKEVSPPMQKACPNQETQGWVSWAIVPIGRNTRFSWSPRLAKPNFR